MVSVSSIPKIDRHYSDSHKILQILLLSFSSNSVVINNKDLSKVVGTKNTLFLWNATFDSGNTWLTHLHVADSFTLHPILFWNMVVKLV